MLCSPLIASLKTYGSTGKTGIYQEMWQGCDLAGIMEKWGDDLYDWSPVMKRFFYRVRTKEVTSTGDITVVVGYKTPEQREADEVLYS